jgi:hypothetical protein
MKPETWRRQRHPFSRLALLASAAVLGIGSRRFAARLPGFVASYAGDTLWALAAFLGIGILFPNASTKRVAVLALLVSLLVEISQLSKAPWLESIRRTPIGGVILGYDFVWSDLACYAIGVILGVTIEVAWTLLARPTRMRQADIEGRDDP